jgi:hypothetical protein
MPKYGDSSEKDEIGPFNAALHEDGLRPIDHSDEPEGTDENFDRRKKKDSRWHSFKTP